MNAQTQISATASNNTVGLLNLESFELSQRIAKMLSSSTLVPEQYRATTKVKCGKDDYGNQIFRDEPNPNGLSNCIIALNMSNRMGADPLMIMQNLYLIEGRPAWSSQFIMAAINTCGRFSSLRFEFKDEGEKEVEYQETTWVNRKKQVTTKSMKIQNWTCYAWVIEKGSVNPDGTPVVLKSSVISMEMAIKEGWYQKNGSKWQTMPEQMLRYRAASFFGRVYAPELLMGLRSVDEEQDRVIDVTPQSDISPAVVQPDTAPVKKLILKAKTLDELDDLANQVESFEGKDKADLEKILNAQYKKFAEPNVIESVVEEVKNPEPVQEPVAVENIEVVEITGKTSDEVLQEYNQRLNDSKSVAEINETHEVFVGDQRLTTGHLEDLKKLCVALKAKLKPKPVAIDPTNSDMAKGGLLTLIQKAKDVAELETLAKTITNTKPRLLPEHNQELLTAYAQRKEILAQADIFEVEPEPQMSYVESAIHRIRNAISQDDINDVYADPAFEELSGADRELIDQEAQQREAELQD